MPRFQKPLYYIITVFAMSDVEKGTGLLATRVSTPSTQTAAWLEGETAVARLASSSASSSEEHDRKSSQTHRGEIFSKKQSKQPGIPSAHAVLKTRSPQHSDDDSQLLPFSNKGYPEVAVTSEIKTSQIVKDGRGSEISGELSRRMSAGDSSLDGCRSITSQSQSETRSYRDRLRDRFHTVKERAGNMMTETKSHPHLSNIFSKEAAHSRADALLKREEMELEAALAKRGKISLKNHNASKSAQLPAADDESTEFFMKEWDPESVPVNSPVHVESQEEENVNPSSSGELGGDPVDFEEREKNKPSAADYLGFSKDEWELVDHSGGPIIQDDVGNSEKGIKLYSYPSGIPVALEERLGPGRKVRYREEEGLFVGFHPNVNARNCHRLERRLLAEGARQWFGDDGELDVLPNPIKLASYRPPVLYHGEHFDVEDVLQVKPPEDMTSKSAHHSLLEIQIGDLHFQHHPLFSQEHVLAQHLLDLYSQFRVRETMHIEERLCGRLDSLRQAYDNLQSMLNVNAADITSQQLDRMQIYKKEIRVTWQLWMTESFRSRQLLVSLLASWRDLKRLRDSQGFVSTPYRLVIHQQPLSEKEILVEKAKWEREIRQACNEMELEKQEKFNSQWDDYQIQLQSWQRHQITVRGRVGEAKNESVSGNEIDEGIGERTSSDKTSHILSTDERPIEPQPVDRSELHAEVLEKMLQCLRPPGEPKVQLYLNESVKIQDDPKDLGEKQRRNALKRCRLFVKIFFNDKEVCRTQSYHLSSRFRVVFDECYSIKISKPPKSIFLIIIEHGAGGRRHQLAQIFLPIPTIDKTVKSAVMENHEFSSDRIVSFSHAGVGSGTFIRGSAEMSKCLYTSGVVSCRVGWGIEEETEAPLAPLEKYLPPSCSNNEYLDLFIESGKRGMFDITKVTEWAMKSQLDPNDPSNSSFLFLLMNLNTSSKEKSDFFRLNPLESDFDFCNIAELDKNPRLRLLSLRAQGEAPFREWKCVPIREKEIPVEVFKTHEKRLDGDAHEAELDMGMTWSDPLSSHRAWGRLYLGRVYQRVLAQCKQAQRTASLHHIVIEEQVPDISTLGLTFMKWLQPKRPLRPSRRERKKLAVQNLAGQDVRLIVNVIRAFEVPVRKTTDSLLGSTSIQSSSNLGFTTVAIRPFVEVSFQGFTVRTTTAEGANPTWNHDLQIPVRPGTKESESIFINLFDELIVDLVQDDRQRETSIHQRLERNWLASLHIPFSTLLHNARIEGTFKMYSPPMLLGYERESHQRSGWQSGSFSPDQGGQIFPNRDATFINLFITVQPALNPPEPFNERLESSEVSALEEHLLHFEKEVDAVVSHRRLKTLVIDASGKSVCITRFFRPISPPELISGGAITEETAARFVSMVPVSASQGMLDVWLTCDQVLRLGWGDSWAHAVLLCCFLLGLGKTAWLLVGTGIPHGQTAYVLIREKEDQKNYYWVWDPVAGQRFSILDSFCPLQQIFGLINDENIWINLQKEELPRRTQFDLNRRSDWLTAFGRVGFLTAPVGSVQPASIHYSSTSSSASNSLQDKLEKYLKDSLMKWRCTKITLWNRYCIAVLRKILPHLEHMSCFGPGENSSPHHTRELQHILASHKVCGFPINVPYTTVDAIVEAVKATGVHLNQDENAEFALAVYVHSYPNNILSIWVYVASLTKLR